MFVEGGGNQGAEGQLGADGSDEFVHFDDERLDEEIGQLAAHIAAATCRWLLMVAEFERRLAHEDRGFPDATSWLAWRCSIARRTAFENLRVARALGDLPRITTAFARGHLSYSKVRALTRVANGENEGELVELALEATAAQLDRIVNGYRRVIDDDEAMRIANRRHFALSWQDDGSLRFTGELPLEEGALLVEALDLARRQLEEGTSGDARPDMADALMGLVGGSGGTVQAEAGEKADRKGPRESEVVVHIDLDDLREGENGGSNADVDPVSQPLAPSVAKRLACDAAIVSIIERDGEPLSVGRRTRSIPPSISRALRARDRGCRFPGCERTQFIDAHHLVHWANGGETKLSNLVRLCRHHHRCVHEGKVSATLEGRDLVFRYADGMRIPDAPSAIHGSARACRMVRDDLGGSADSWDITARSRGAPFDLGLTVAGLMQKKQPVFRRER